MGLTGTGPSLYFLDRYHRFYLLFLSYGLAPSERGQFVVIGLNLDGLIFSSFFLFGRDYDKQGVIRVYQQLIQPGFSFIHMA